MATKKPVAKEPADKPATKKREGFALVSDSIQESTAAYRSMQPKTEPATSKPPIVSINADLDPDKLHLRDSRS